jgi:hypothetical protein
LAAQYPRNPVLLQFSQAPPVGPDDFCLNSRPENARGFANTEFYRFGNIGHFRGGAGE